MPRQVLITGAPGTALAEVAATFGPSVADGTAVVRLSRRILALAGARDHVLPLPVDAMTLAPCPLPALAAAQYAAAAAAAWPEGELVCADPSLALTLPLWLAAAGGTAPQVILVAEPVETIVAALGRHGASLSEALTVVADHWLAMLSTAPADARIVDAGALRLAPSAGSPLPGTAEPQFRLPPGLIPLALRQLAAALGKAHDKRLGDVELPNLVQLQRDADHRKLFAGATTLVADEPAPAQLPEGRRRVVLHLHLFKNAGSSVDVVLRRNFGERWREREFRSRPAISNADVVNTYLRRTEGFDALSSHTAHWFLDHADDELDVVPIIFLRHPILRARSAYGFEVRQVADTTGARLAKENDFAGYVTARLTSRDDLSLRDFQARRFASLDSRTPTDIEAAAFRGLARAPFVGIVEDFDASMHRLDDLLRPQMPTFSAFTVRANATQAAPVDLDAAVEAVRAELGERLADVLTDANALDLALWTAARTRWPATGGGSTTPLASLPEPSK